MNAQLKIAPRVDAPEPMFWTLSHYEQAWDAGVFPPDAELELVNGVIYAMPADGYDTISWNEAIARWLFANLPQDRFRIIPDKTLRLGEQLGAAKPDFWVFPENLSLREVEAKDVLLAIEVADHTFLHDRDVKGPVYAAAGVREYWLFEVQAPRLWVYRLDAPGAYGAPQMFEGEAVARALLIPDLTLRLSELNVRP